MLSVELKLASEIEFQNVKYIYIYIIFETLKSLLHPLNKKPLRPTQMKTLKYLLRYPSENLLILALPPQTLPTKP